ncbi:hypothetical protein [Methylobacterium sp. WL116]|uniref:hypothetical protein n=1 Tax=Methylobacterium sp. WL116 TaxID=2603889 RepID=UPI0011CA5E1C|nr:hypothetical protein [Methylobacterium sp. WL116]TXM92239.1 hypothetical protein FV223_12530 [Methylobacterium sp. WL116]
MQTLGLSDPHERGPAADRRAVALANVLWFRALAWRALRDGAPKAELRAANARAAARIVLRQARRETLVRPLVLDAVAIEV